MTRDQVIGAVVSMVLGFIFSGMLIFILLQGDKQPEEPVKTQKWCLVEVASYGDTLSITGTGTGEYQVIARPDGAIEVLEPCEK